MIVIYSKASKLGYNVAAILKLERVSDEGNACHSVLIEVYQPKLPD